MPLWKVLIVEDDPHTRDYFAASVGRSADLQLLAAVGSVGDALEWLARAAEQGPAHAPDVLLTDLGLPDGSGLSVIRATLQHFAACEPLGISMFGDEDHVLASIEAGALGYIHKDSSPEDVAHSIVKMKQGESPISPMIARRVLYKYRALQIKKPLTPVNTAFAAPDFLASDFSAGAAPSETAPALSKREQAVLEQIARGFSYAEIARLQSVSVHTVQSHVKNLYTKLAVHSKSEAVFEATKMGLLHHAN